MALTDKLTAIANAIRAKTGKTESLTLEQMPTEIESIATGGGSSDDVRYVTFRNEATGEEFVKPVATGDDCVDVVAKGLWEKPTKPSDAQYDYTFYGWGASDGGAADSTILQNITEDKTVYAIFTATVKYYTITYYDEDGTTVLKTESLAYGAMPSYKPTKSGYELTGWTPTITTVTGNATYVAVWEKLSWEWDLTDGTLTISGAGPMDDYSNRNQQPWYSSARNIKKVVIGDGITHIGDNAFNAFTTAKSVTYGAGVTSIGAGAFTGWAFSKIIIPDQITSLGNDVFNSCTSTSVYIGTGITTIPMNTFKSCSKLASVTIPSNITNIVYQAFMNCRALSSATFANTDGWKVTKNTGETTLNISSENLSNTATAAGYLTDTYMTYTWERT